MAEAARSPGRASRDAPYPAQLDRRRLLVGMAAASVLTATASPAAADAANWAVFKQRFLDADGRIIDTGNKNVSHSEGQGWGMLFAESHDDRQAFERLWAWTNRTLRRSDGLYSWRWVPWGTNHVPDTNNASDGDILMAWALMRAAVRWREPRFDAASRALQRAILDRLSSSVGPLTVLLPGMDGFHRGARRVVNLSYYVWPALRDFSAGGIDAARWRRLDQDGLAILDRAAFGALKLPPDWALVGQGDVAIADGWPPRFGYDAIRIPLYLAWGRRNDRLDRFVAAWRTARVGTRPPAWVDLRSGAMPGYVANGGYEAVEKLAIAGAGGGRIAEAAMPALDAADDYYAASLKMLARLAAHELKDTR